MKETLNWKKLIKVPKKLFSGLLAASMAFTCVVDQNFTTVHAAKKDPIREEKRNPEINPEFTIQHYLNFEAVSMGLKHGSNRITYPLRDIPDWESNPWDPAKLQPGTEGTETITGTILDVINVESRGQIPVNGTNTAPLYGVAINSDGSLRTHKTKKVLFEDEKVEYFNKPNMKYMNRLYNEVSEGSYNENYTLAQVWIAYNLKNSRSVDEKDFHVVDVPKKVINNETRHDPSRIIFTNNPDYKDKETNQGLNKSGDDYLPTKFGTGNKEHVVIYVKEGMTIRFLFDPTSSDYVKENVNFFDYDISNGVIYASEADAKAGTNSFPTSEQEKSLKNKKRFSQTGKQGINHPDNYPKNAQGAHFAFGNVNTGSGWGSQLWYKDTLSNKINGYNSRNNKGTTFGLVKGLDTENGTLIWNDGVVAPAIFSYERDADGNPISGKDKSIRGKTNFVQNEFPLRFNRTGGTYILDGVGNTQTNNLSKFEKVYDLTNSNGTHNIIYSNSFWPMDSAPTYGTDGHDMKFGYGVKQSDGSYNEDSKNQFTGLNGEGTTPLEEPKNFPPSDDGKNHNSYFGMSFSADFVIDPGYAGPLRYYFYGDDDMYVFLSKVNNYGTSHETLSNTTLVADIGGVHSSVGMYVNLWDAVKTISGRTEKGILPYHKADGTENEAEYYRLTFFYTERGASGSSCYMRFTLPFEELKTVPMKYTGNLEVEKEVKVQISDDQEIHPDHDRDYTFKLELKNPLTLSGKPTQKFEEGTDLVNRYGYTIYDADHNKVSDGFAYVNSQFNLKHGQYMRLEGLPEGTLYRVSELNEDGSIITTFASGKVVVGTDQKEIFTDYEEGKVIEGATQENNYVKFINASAPGSLTLSKAVSGDRTTDTFSFEIDLNSVDKVTNVKTPLPSVSWMKNGVEQPDLVNSEGKYTFELKQDDKIVVYNLPNHTSYKIQEKSDDSFVVEDITVNGNSAGNTTTTVNPETGTVEGMIYGEYTPESPITDKNRPQVSVHYHNRFEPNGAASLEVTKHLQGRPSVLGETYEFVLKPVNQEAKDKFGKDWTNRAAVEFEEGLTSQKALFSPMSFVAKDIDKTFEFEVSEIIPDQPYENMEYDPTVYQAILKPVQNESTKDIDVNMEIIRDGQAADSLEFTNVYSPITTYRIGFNKEIIGEGQPGDQYVFKIEPASLSRAKSDQASSTPMPKTDEVVIKYDGTESVNRSFDPITYEEPGLYHYVITEMKTNEIDNIVLDKKEHEVTIRVEKDKDDQGVEILEASMRTTKDINGNLITFKNYYQNTDVEIPVTKHMEGRQMTENDVFQFVLLDENGNRVDTLMLHGKEGELSVEGKFRPLNYQKVGTHRYTIKEIAGTDPSLTYDLTEYEVVVDVKTQSDIDFSEDYSLVYEVTVTKDGKPFDGNSAIFTNKFNTFLEWAPTVTKQTVGSSPAGYSFTMDVERKEDDGIVLPVDENGNPNLNAISDENGHISFANIKFTKPGEYTITVKENTPETHINGFANQIQYDQKIINHQLVIEKDEKTGLLSINTEKSELPKENESIFTNDAGLQISKELAAGNNVTLTEDDLNKEFSFKLTLKDSNNQEFTKTLKMVKVINGIAQVPTDIASNSVLKLKGGESLRLYGLPIGTKYTIEELPAEGYVLVNDSSEGVIGVNTELIHKFRNTKKGMDAAQIQGYKRLSNTEGSNRVLKENDFQFVLEPVKATVEKEETDKDETNKEENPETAPIQTPDNSATTEGTGADDGTLEETGTNLDSSNANQPGIETGAGSDSSNPETDGTENQNANQSPTQFERRINLSSKLKNPVDLKPAEMPMPQGSVNNKHTVGNKENGTFIFPEITFKQAGTYTYRVTEFIPASQKPEDQMIFDKTSFLAVIEVEHTLDDQGNVNGVKTTSIKYSRENDNAEIEDILFTNTYVGLPDLEIEKFQQINGGALTKDLQNVKAGDLITYHLQVSVPETATAAAKDIVVTDFIPNPDRGSDLDARLTFLPGSQGNGSYNEKTGELRWTIDSLSPGASTTVKFTVIAPSVKNRTTFTNIAQAAYGNNPGGPNETTNTEQVTVQIDPTVPNLGIEKFQIINNGDKQNGEDPIWVEAGDEVTYELLVTNTGNADAINAVVTDVVPEGLELIESSLGQASYDEKSRMITWNLPVVAKQSSMIVSFRARVPQVDKPTLYTNQGFVKYENNPEDPDEKIPSNIVKIETDVPDLEIQKYQALNSKEPEDFTQDILTAVNKDVVTYKLVVTNTSKVKAENVIVKDVIPAGLKYVANSVSVGGNYVTAEDQEMVIWNLGTLKPGESREVTFQVKVPVVDSYTKWTNMASTAFGKDPENPIEKDSNEVIVQTDVPELKIHKFQKIDQPENDFVDTPVTGEIGDKLIYKIVVENIGKATATDVVITDQVPAGLILDKNSITPKPVSVDDKTQTITWNLGDLKVGEKRSVEFAVEIPKVNVETTWTNGANTSFGNNPDNPGNSEKPETPDKPNDPENPGTPDKPDTPQDPNKPVDIPSNKVDVSVNLPALEIEKLQGLNMEVIDINMAQKEELNAKANDIVTYFIRLTSNGKAAAKDVRISDVIPEGLILVEGSISDGGVLNGNIVEWAIGDLNPGQNVVRSFQVRIPEIKEASTWVNVASSVYSNNSNNPDGSNGADKPYAPVDSNEVKVNTNIPKLKIQKEQKVNDGEFTTDIRPVKPEDAVTYQLSITNDSAVTALDVTLKDKVPSGLELIENSISDDGQAKDGEIIWKFGDIEAGETRKVTFQVKVPVVEESTKWTNVAYVSYPNNPENPKDPQDPTKPGGPDKEDPSNEVTIETEVQAPAVDLIKQQSKNGETPTTSKLEVSQGDVVTYILTVFSKGVTAAENVRIEDVIPEGLTYVEGSISEGGIVEGDTLSWMIPVLEPGNSYQVSFKVLVPEVTKTTTWKNIAGASFGNDPEGDKTYPSNEVEIKEPINPGKPGTSGNPQKPDRPTSSLNGKPTTGKPANTATETNPTLWISAMITAIVTAGTLFFVSFKRKKKKMES